MHIVSNGTNGANSANIRHYKIVAMGRDGYKDDVVSVFTEVFIYLVLMLQLRYI